MRSIVIAIVTVFFVISTSCDMSPNSEVNEITGEEGVILYRTGSTLYLLDVKTERTQMVTDSVSGSARWSPDGQRIAYHGPSIYEGSRQIYAVNADDSGKRIVTLWERLGKLEQHPDGGGRPVWSPDGQRIAFTRCLFCEAVGNREIFIVDLDTTAGLKEVRLTNNPYSDNIADWSPDGKKILFQSDFALDGSYDARGDWYTMNTDGSDKQKIISVDSTFGASLLRYSPDGKKIALIGGTPGTRGEIHIMDADGSNIERITDNEVQEIHVSWAPDGDRLAYQANSVMFIIRTDGTLLRRLPVGNQPEWRPDNRHIIYRKDGDYVGGGPFDESDPKIHGSLVLMDVDTKEKWQLLPKTKQL